MTLRCEQCGRDFQRRTGGGPIPKYCGGSCRARACTARAKQDGRYEQWYATTLHRRRRPLSVKTCVVCGNDFETTHGSAVTCGSDDCQHQQTNRRMADLMRRRRAQKRNTVVIPIQAHTIYERDAWTCGICWLPVDKTLRWPNPQSPSLDHIVPLSRAGTHTTDNVQLAHLGCNGRKSDHASDRLPFAA